MRYDILLLKMSREILRGIRTCVEAVKRINTPKTRATAGLTAVSLLGLGGVGFMGRNLGEEFNIVRNHPRWVEVNFSGAINNLSIAQQELGKTGPNLDEVNQQVLKAIEALDPLGGRPYIEAMKVMREEFPNRTVIEWAGKSVTDGTFTEQRQILQAARNDVEMLAGTREVKEYNDAWWKGLMFILATGISGMTGGVVGFAAVKKAKSAS